MLKFSKPVVALIIGMAFSAAAVSADKPFVKVNGVAVSQATAEMFMAKGKTNGMPDTPELKNTVREELIRRELMVQEAIRIGLDKQPEVAAEAEAEKKKMIVQAEAMKQTIIIRAYVRDFIKKHPVTDTQLKATYDASRAKGGDTEYKARHILVKTEGDANAIIARLDKGGRFEDLARESIEPGAAASGGDLGWASPARYAKPFGDALRGMTKGKYSTAPVRTEFGYHVIKLDDARPFKGPSFDEVKHMLQKDAEAMMVEKMIADLRTKARID